MKSWQQQTMKIGGHCDAVPTWEELSQIPVHSDGCPRFDGKRCDAMGFRPGIVCEPVVIVMAEMLTKSKPEGGDRG